MVFAFLLLPEAWKCVGRRTPLIGVYDYPTLLVNTIPFEPYMRRLV